MSSEENIVKLEFNDYCVEGCTKHISCCIRHVKNPLQLLCDTAVVLESDVDGPLQPGDKEQAMILRHARDQLLIRPSDPVVWSIIRWTLATGTSEEEINKAASLLRRREIRSVS